MLAVVTMPAYNEEKTIGHVVSEIKKVMSGQKFSYKILLVDDGSTDGTAKVAKAGGAIVISHPKNYGLSEAFRTEMKKCLEMKADVIIHIDADRQYDPKEMPKLIAKLAEGYDLVLGSRFPGKVVHMPWIKRMGNKAFTHIVRSITGLDITDSQTGFRAFTREVAKLPISSTYSYTQEQIIRAAKEKFKVAEVPASFAKREEGGSRLMGSPLEYAIKASINLTRVYRDYQPLKFFGLSGLALFSMGFIIGIYFLYLHLTKGITGHLGLFFLMTALMVIGIQLALFGFIADAHRKS